eukprot:gnl/TRDRNA2_/TRDRNA2_44538_c0_seq1.p1 gnl/TRDRNA2_/TRDRNA2_44538_c0~~gnl/TRDRNA2_/TRDRNA2_44538_c0_seq1.p1  ORF type:complete len:528 (+),score=79.27 gnl/TRDRNA2_/TRDRNA2_44538_c0_seq1:50-1633(+)
MASGYLHALISLLVVVLSTDVAVSISSPDEPHEVQSPEDSETCILFQAKPQLSRASFSEELQPIVPVETPPSLAMMHVEQRKPYELHKSPQARAEGTALSLMLVGAIAFMMLIFYLVNYNDPDIQVSVWKMLSSTISTFTSVLLYRCITLILIERLGVNRDGSRKGKAAACLLSLFLVFYIVAQAAMFCFLKFNSPRMSMIAEGTFLGRAAAFAAAFGFGLVQEMEPFSTSAWASFTVVLIAGALLFFSAHVTRKFREVAATAPDGEIHEPERWWLDQTESIGEDIRSFSLGFLLMQAVRFGVCGSLQNYSPMEYPKGITQKNANALLASAVSFALLTVLGSFGVSRLQVSQGVLRLAKNGVNVSALTMAWCFLFWGEWQIYLLNFLDGSRIAACMLVALCQTFSAVAWLFLLNKVAKNVELLSAALRAIIPTLGVLVGISWARAFNVAFQDLADLRHFGGNKGMKMVILVVTLLAVVLPAWRMYILPKAFPTLPDKSCSSQPQETTSTRLQRRRETFTASSALRGL